MACRDCGQSEHAGGCDLVEFYHFQRWARAMERTPAPPSPAVMTEGPPVDEAPPTLCTNDNLGMPATFVESAAVVNPEWEATLSTSSDLKVDEHGNVQFTPLASVTNDPKPEIVKVKVKRPKQGKIVTTGKAKPVDSPEIAAKREAIRQARVARMEYVRSLRKKKSV